MSDKVKIFISYAHLDAEKVLPLYQRLKDAGFEPWIDREHLLPGVKWRVAIEQALREADFFLLCLSSQSSNRRGFIQREINTALDLWEERLQDDIYFIPLRLEECDIPVRVAEFQCVNWFEANGWERLRMALLHQSEKLRESYQLNNATSPTYTVTKDEPFPNPQQVIAEPLSSEAKPVVFEWPTPQTLPAIKLPADPPPSLKPQAN